MKTLWNAKSNINDFFKEYSFGVKKDWCLIKFEWKLQLAHSECLYRAKILSESEYSSLKMSIYYPDEVGRTGYLYELG